MSKIDLNDAQSRIARFYRVEGRMPSYSEICRIFEYKSKNAAYRLVKKMIDAGIVSKSAGGKLVPQDLGKPVKVLGTVQAGFPTAAEDDTVWDSISLDEYLITNPQHSFMLRVMGESMIEEGIRPGDMVIVERGRFPKTGDVVLAMIDNDWTLKYYENLKGRVRLVPGNKDYPALVPKTELKVGGVVTSVIRKYF